jgi:hypothetical protein
MFRRLSNARPTGLLHHSHQRRLYSSSPSSCEDSGAILGSLWGTGAVVLVLGLVTYTDLNRKMDRLDNKLNTVMVPLPQWYVTTTANSVLCKARELGL